jgi:transposase-like protein
MKKTFSPKLKAQIALETVKGLRTINQISSEYEVHPTQISVWKKQLIDCLPELFTDKRNLENKSKDELIERLYKIVGQRDIELDWLKKKLHIDT